MVRSLPQVTQAERIKGGRTLVHAGLITILDIMAKEGKSGAKMVS